MPYRDRSSCPGPANILAIVMVIAAFLFLPFRASAGLLLDAEMRVTMEDNIVGLLNGGGSVAGTGPGSGMMSGAMQKGFGGGMPGGGAGSSSVTYTGAGSESPSDISLSALAELGGYTGTGGSLSFFATGMAERTDFRQHDEYDRTDAELSAGGNADLSEMLSLRLRGFERFSRYDNDPDRNCTTSGGAVSLRERLTRDLRLRQTADYRSSRATYEDFSYRGPAYRFGADYGLTEQLLLTAGYGFQSQQYQDIASTALRSTTASFGAAYDLTLHWNTSLAYDRQVARAGTSDIITRDNILSFAVRWTY